MDFVIGEFDVIFVRSIPFLENDLPPICSGLGSDEFLVINHGEALQNTFRSPTVSSESHLILTFFPRRSFAMTSIITIVDDGGKNSDVHRHVHANLTHIRLA